MQIVNLLIALTLVYYTRPLGKTVMIIEQYTDFSWYFSFFTASDLALQYRAAARQLKALFYSDNNMKFS